VAVVFVGVADELPSTGNSLGSTEGAADFDTSCTTFNVGGVRTTPVGLAVVFVEAADEFVVVAVVLVGVAVELPPQRSVALSLPRSVVLRPQRSTEMSPQRFATLFPDRAFGVAGFHPSCIMALGDSGGIGDKARFDSKLTLLLALSSWAGKTVPCAQIAIPIAQATRSVLLVHGISNSPERRAVKLS
jgi:hypothetical protein